MFSHSDSRATDSSSGTTIQTSTTWQRLLRTIQPSIFQFKPCGRKLPLNSFGFYFIRFVSTYGGRLLTNASLVILITWIWQKYLQQTRKTFRWTKCESLWITCTNITRTIYLWYPESHFTAPPFPEAWLTIIRWIRLLHIRITMHSTGEANKTFS